MNGFTDGTPLPFMSKFWRWRLPYLLVAAGLCIGWSLDRAQLMRRSAEVESKCRQKIDRMYLGLGIYEEARTFASVYRRHQAMGQEEFSRYMQETAVLEVARLFNFKDSIEDFVPVDDRAETARRLLDLLGCESVDEFREAVKLLGFKESDFVYKDAPSSRDFQSFYEFIESATER